MYFVDLCPTHGAKPLLVSVHALAVVLHSVRLFLVRTVLLSAFSVAFDRLLLLIYGVRFFLGWCSSVVQS